ncbi:PAS domain S-box protein [Geobacillus sp. CAMR5420]|uniref:PAS domain-containing protein n=1 Tax=Geobacillus TaxID=129337 RepID=UPI0018E2D634|nr:PAS domain S-box protein [Geobacillus sp. CAMR5420]
MLLRQMDHLYEQIVEHTSQGIMVTDADARILFVNRAFTTITGYSKDDVLGKTPRLWQSGKHGKPFYARLWQSLLETGQWQGEIWNRKKDGTIYPQWLHINAVKNEAGRIVNYVALFSDISERKAIEHELQQREEQYRFITENSSDVIATISQDGALTYVSPACRYVLGYEQEELIGRSVLEWIEPDEHDELPPLPMETDDAFRILTFCFRFRKKDGTYS